MNERISFNNAGPDGDETNVGVFAKQKIPMGVLVLAVPTTCILQPKIGHMSAVGRALLELCGTGGADEEALLKKNGVFLTLAILASRPAAVGAAGAAQDEERSGNDDESDDSDVFRAHYASLPCASDLASMPVFWNGEDRGILKQSSPLAHNQCEEEVRGWEKEHADVALLLSTADKTLPFSKADWLHARAIVASRNMQIPKTVFETIRPSSAAASSELPEAPKDAVVPPAGPPQALSKSQKKRLKKGKKKTAGGGSAAAEEEEDTTVPVVVPIIDLANHSAHANVVWGVNTDDGRFEMRAMRDLEAGEELSYNYNKNQAQYKFLLHYGFVPKETTPKQPIGKYVTMLTLSPRMMTVLGATGAAFEAASAADAMLLKEREVLWPLVTAHSVSGVGDDRSGAVSRAAGSTAAADPRGGGLASWATVLTTDAGRAPLAFGHLLLPFRVAAALSSAEVDGLARTVQAAVRAPKDDSGRAGLQCLLLAPLSRENEARALKLLCPVLEKRCGLMKTLERTLLPRIEGGATGGGHGHANGQACLALLKGGKALARSSPR